jgi:hypothetical protein
MIWKRKMIFKQKEKHLRQKLVQLIFDREANAHYIAQNPEVLEKLNSLQKKIEKELETT